MDFVIPGISSVLLSALLVTPASGEDRNPVVNPWTLNQSPYGTDGYQQRRPWGETPSDSGEVQPNNTQEQQLPGYQYPPQQQGYNDSNPYLYNEPSDLGSGVYSGNVPGAPGYGGYPGLAPGIGGYPGLTPGIGGYGYPGLGVPGLGLPGGGYGLPGIVSSTIY